MSTSTALRGEVCNVFLSSHVSSMRFGLRLLWLHGLSCLSDSKAFGRMKPATWSCLTDYQEAKPQHASFRRWDETFAEVKIACMFCSGGVFCVQPRKFCQETKKLLSLQDFPNAAHCFLPRIRDVLRSLNIPWNGAWVVTACLTKRSAHLNHLCQRGGRIAQQCCCCFPAHCIMTCVSGFTVVLMWRDVFLCRKTSHWSRVAFCFYPKNVFSVKCECVSCLQKTSDPPNTEGKKRWRLLGKLLLL